MKPGRMWTAAEDAELLRLRASGASWPAIDARLGRPPRSAERRHLRLTNVAFREKMRKASSDYAKKNRARILANRAKWRSRPGTRFHQMAKAAQHRSSRNGRECRITTADIRELWEHQRGRCAYTGREMTLAQHQPNTVSLDRRDSSKGYDRDNVVLCCHTVNMMKGTMSYSEFLGWCYAVVVPEPAETAQPSSEDTP